MLKTRKYAWKDCLWTYQDCNFGDMWAIANFLLRVSQETGLPAKMYHHSAQFRSIVLSIVPHLDAKGIVEFVNFPTAGLQQRRLRYCDPFIVKWFRTKEKWLNARRSNIVTYQFDGRHLSNLKNLPLDRVHYLRKQLIDLGFNPIDVGGMKPLDYIIHTMANARFHVGCPSGMGIVALSVGVPVYNITRFLSDDFVAFMQTCQYKNRPVQTFKFVDDFVRHVRDHEVDKILKESEIRGLLV